MEMDGGNNADMTSPQTLLRAWDIHPSRQMGQNFLVDPSTARMIITRAAIQAEDTILEIGAGLGALTIPAARAAARVIAVEKDRRLAGLLKTELLAQALENVDLIEADIMDIDIGRFSVPGKLTVIGNLPYNISSQILVMLIRSRRFVSRAILMFQKELCRRLMSLPGSRDYGRITVMLRSCAEVSTLAEVKAGCFHPRPKIDSEVLEIRFDEKPRHEDIAEDDLFLVIKSAFAKRRKTLKNALSTSWLDIDSHTALHMLEKADIAPQRRAETLSVKEFFRLTRVYQELRREYPSA